MNQNHSISELGELKLIEIIEELVFNKLRKKLIKDDSFFFELDEIKDQKMIIFNSDMFVSSSDAPKQMSFYQMGRKAVIMNVSDLFIKAVKPKGIIVSLGLPDVLKVASFKELVVGIIDQCEKFDLDYIGGDLNKTGEIIINPTVFGIKDPSKILYRTVIEEGDILVSNNKFGLTGVGFDILVNKNGNPKDYPKYEKSIKSVLEPDVFGVEAHILAKKNWASSAIDSSDGLLKSLKDLMLSNPHIGFEIDFNENLIDKQAIEYSEEFNIPIEKLVLEAGEEFIHLFTIKPENSKIISDLIKRKGGKIFEIGRVISEEKVFIVKDGVKLELEGHGYQHFR
ncbi:MAG: thiamine-monophosphate kinase [Candidatus Hodarchaeota archaeon]